MPCHEDMLCCVKLVHGGACIHTLRGGICSSRFLDWESLESTRRRSLAGGGGGIGLE